MLLSATAVGQPEHGMQQLEQDTAEAINTPETPGKHGALSKTRSSPGQLLANPALPPGHGSGPAQWL